MQVYGDKAYLIFKIIPIIYVAALNRPNSCFQSLFCSHFWLHWLRLTPENDNSYSEDLSTQIWYFSDYFRIGYYVFRFTRYSTPHYFTLQIGSVRHVIYMYIAIYTVEVCNEFAMLR